MSEETPVEAARSNIEEAVAGSDADEPAAEDEEEAVEMEAAESESTPGEDADPAANDDDAADAAGSPAPAAPQRAPSPRPSPPLPAAMQSLLAKLRARASKVDVIAREESSGESEEEEDPLPVSLTQAAMGSEVTLAGEDELDDDEFDSDEDDEDGEEEDGEEAEECEEGEGEVTASSSTLAAGSAPTLGSADGDEPMAVDCTSEVAVAADTATATQLLADDDDLDLANPGETPRDDGPSRTQSDSQEMSLRLATQDIDQLYADDDAPSANVPMSNSTLFPPDSPSPPPAEEPTPEPEPESEEDDDIDEVMPEWMRAKMEKIRAEKEKLDPKKVTADAPAASDDAEQTQSPAETTEAAPAAAANETDAVPMDTDTSDPPSSDTAPAPLSPPVSSPLVADVAASSTGVASEAADHAAATMADETPVEPVEQSNTDEKKTLEEKGEKENEEATGVQAVQAEAAPVQAADTEAALSQPQAEASAADSAVSDAPLTPVAGDMQSTPIASSFVDDAAAEDDDSGTGSVTASKPPRATDAADASSDDASISPEEEAAGLAEIQKNFIDDAPESEGRPTHRELDDQREAAELEALKKKFAVRDAPPPGASAGLVAALGGGAGASSETALAAAPLQRQSSLGSGATSLAARLFLAADEAQALSLAAARRLRSARSGMVDEEAAPDADVEDESAIEQRRKERAQVLALKYSGKAAKAARRITPMNTSAAVARTSSASPSPPPVAMETDVTLLVESTSVASASWTRQDSFAAPINPSGEGQPDVARKTMAHTSATRIQLLAARVSGKPVSAAPTAPSTTTTHNFDQFNADLRRQQSVKQIRAGSFLARAPSLAAPLQRTISTIVNGELQDATDFSSLLGERSTSTAAPIRTASTSMGGHAAAKRAASKMASKGFVFRKHSDVSRDGFENVRAQFSRRARDRGAQRHVCAPSALCMRSHSCSVHISSLFVFSPLPSPPPASVRPVRPPPHSPPPLPPCPPVRSPSLPSSRTPSAASPPSAAAVRRAHSKGRTRASRPVEARRARCSIDSRRRQRCKQEGAEDARVAHTSPPHEHRRAT